MGQIASFDCSSATEVIKTNTCPNKAAQRIFISQSKPEEALSVKISPHYVYSLSKPL